MQVNISGSIVVGNTTSNPIQLNSFDPVSIIFSASTITATTVTFLVSPDGTTYYPAFDDASLEISLTTTGSPKAYNFPIAKMMGYDFIKVREGTSASSVAQRTYNCPFIVVARSL